MKILYCHNYYRLPGGEDQVVADETWLLESNGHQVVHYTRHNDDIEQLSKWALLRKTLWNKETYRELSELISRESPDVMHCANTFPLISPAAYQAAHDNGLPVVQTLHNYRLLCPKAVFMRNDGVCEDCLSKRIAWPAVLHGCYRDSRLASTLVATMLAVHRSKKTYLHAVDRYIALTQFARDKFIEGGFPAEKIAVKPNFVAARPDVGSGEGGYAVFVGRLSPEKGVHTLLRAWDVVGQRFPLKIVGDGPLADDVRQACHENEAIDWLGPRPMEEVQEIVGRAACLIVPSVWYEGLPKTIVESFSKGTPVIASNLGAMAEIVEHQQTGLHFTPGDSNSLADQVQYFLDHPQSWSAMRTAARQVFESKYSPQPNYEVLMEIYEQAAAAFTGAPANAARRQPLPAIFPPSVETCSTQPDHS